MNEYEDMAYAPGNPKAPSYAEALRDAVDRERKVLKENPPAGWQCHRCWRVFEKAGSCCGVRTKPFWRRAQP